MATNVVRTQRQATEPATPPAAPPENPTTGVRSASVGDGGERLTDLADTGKLLCFRPLGIENVEGQLDGKAQTWETTTTQIVEVTDDEGGFVDHGEHPVFWSFVRRQLADQCDDDFPWLVGRLEKGRRAYRIMPATPADVAACDRALGMYAIAEVAANDEAFDDGGGV